MKLEEKLRRPEAGNYVDHGKLFSGEYADEPAYTPDRRWLINEYIFNEKFNRILKHSPQRDIDGKRVNDGRYFQITPGAHELIARFQFEVQGGGSLMAEPIQRTCELRVRYDDFVAGQRYRIEARTLAMSAQGWLYDDQRNVLARARVLRCGVF